MTSKQDLLNILENNIKLMNCYRKIIDKLEIMEDNMIIKIKGNGVFLENIINESLENYAKIIKLNMDYNKLDKSVPS